MPDVARAGMESLLRYVAADGRICPMPNSWVELREMLGPDPPQIAILGGWWAVPPVFKMLIVDAQIRYAAEHGKLPMVDRFLRSLSPREWFYVLSRPSTGAPL